MFPPPSVADNEQVETLSITEIVLNDTIPLFDFRFPVIFLAENEYLGYVNVGISLESVHREIRKAETHSLYLMAFFIGLGSIYSFVLSKIYHQTHHGDC